MDVAIAIEIGIERHNEMLEVGLHERLIPATECRAEMHHTGMLQCTPKLESESASRLHRRRLRLLLPSRLRLKVEELVRNGVAGQGYWIGGTNRVQVNFGDLNLGINQDAPRNLDLRLLAPSRTPAQARPHSTVLQNLKA